MCGPRDGVALHDELREGTMRLVPRVFPQRPLAAGKTPVLTGARAALRSTRRYSHNGERLANGFIGTASLQFSPA